MLTLIRGYNPVAKIILLNPFNSTVGSELSALIDNIITEFDDPEVYKIYIPDNGAVVPAEDYADYLHIKEAGHAKLAAYLLPRVKTILGLSQNSYQFGSGLSGWGCNKRGWF